MTTIEQYHKLKAEHGDILLLFRIGDFYEAYGADAQICANILGIVLTKRQDGLDMAGFPYHALDSYLPKLIRNGKRVAIYDQNDNVKISKTSKEKTNNTPTTMQHTYSTEEHMKAVADIIKTTLSKLQTIPAALDTYYAGLFTHRLDYIKIKRTCNIALNDADINYLVQTSEKYINSL